MHTTIQDHGRFGYQQYGFSPSGVMDDYSSRIANLLVGNGRHEAILEMMLMGGEFMFSESAVIAITGGDCSPKLNHLPVERYRAIQVNAGDKLTCGFIKDGVFSYMAVAGGFVVHKELNSSSTNTRIQLGGKNGRALKADDDIQLKQKTTFYHPKRISPGKMVQKRNSKIRVIEGADALYFSDQDKNSFYQSTFYIASQSDRMGYRLKVKESRKFAIQEMISEGTVLGDIQVPSDGEPIVLLKDRQTTGGYPVIATICSADIPAFVQRPTGSAVQFIPVSVEEAQIAFKEQEARMNEIEKKLEAQESVHKRFDIEKTKDLRDVLEASSFHFFEYHDKSSNLKYERGGINHFESRSKL